MFSIRIKKVNNMDLHHIETYFERADGTKYWFLHGKYHREDGPACEYSEGTKYWYINDLLHREDGPALEWVDGTKEWYLNGSRLTEDLFNKVTKGPVKDLPLYLGQGFDEYISERLKQ